MKKILKSRIFLVLATAIIVGSISVYASGILASNIGYKNGTVQGALDDLYNVPQAKKFCEFKDGTYGTKGNVGSMYECDPGDGVKRNFYILAINNDNTVDMIMQHNLTEGTSTTVMTWNDAMKYIDNNNLQTTWSNVLDVDLPKAQDIANAVGRSSWIAADSDATWWCFASKTQDFQNAPHCNTEATKSYNWLYDYTRECNGCTHSLGSAEAYGYWTRDLVSNTTFAWNVHYNGIFNYSSVSSSSFAGVRPVITVLKSNLYE